MRYCPNCKDMVSSNERFCPDCGERLYINEREKNHDKSNTDNKWDEKEYGVLAKNNDKNGYQQPPNHRTRTRTRTKTRTRIQYRTRPSLVRQPPPVQPPPRPPRSSRPHRSHYPERTLRTHYPPPSQDDSEIIEKAPFNKGTWLGIIAILIIIIATFLPWYAVLIDIETGKYSTDGDFELVNINGFEGFQLNHPPKNNEEQSPIFSFSNFTGGIPLLGLIFLIIVIIGIIRIFIAKTSKKRGRILIKTGIMCFIPIIIILLIVSQLPGIASNFNVSDSYQDVLDTMSSNPISGSYSVNTEDWGNGSLSWGLQYGGWMLIIGACLVITGGILDISSGRKFDEMIEEKGD